MMGQHDEAGQPSEASQAENASQAGVKPDYADQEPHEHNIDEAACPERTLLRQRIDARVVELRGGDPTVAKRSLSELNNEAAKFIKQGDHVSAIAVFRLLFEIAQRRNLTHPELYICYCNCSGAYLHLKLYDEAVQMAEKCKRAAEAALKRGYKGLPTYLKAIHRQGQALLGLGRNREAAQVFEEGVGLDPLNPDLKLGLQAANEGVLRDLVEGKGRETRAIEYPQPSQRISYHPYAAPLHKIKTDDMLPVKLLTPFQAENDHHIKDTYNYATVQADIRMPKRHLRLLEDSFFNSRWEDGIRAAVEAIAAEEKDCRVLNLGAGAGLHAMMALRAGAYHVICVERWLYLALLCKEVLLANKFSEELFKVLYKRPTDLTLINDVPVCANLLVANIFDEGLLTSGIIPAVNHALGNLLTSDAIVFPASATVYAQAVEIRTGDVCGFDMSAANLYRWHPAYAAGTPWNAGSIIPLSQPKEVWYFDLGNPPSKSDTKTVDLEFTRLGRFNAVMFWYKLHLFGDVYLSTGPEAVKQGLKCLQPAVQYLAGELPVDAGTVIPLLASHNTVRMRFDVETADYLHLMKPEAAFPHFHFAMLADESKYAAYGRAIARAVARVKKEEGEAHVLDMGCGTGVLAMLAAKAGADSVVACDLLEPACDVARKAVAANHLSKRVSVVHRDVGLLQRGREVRPLGVNLVVTDLFDAGLMGDDFPYLLELARRKVVQPGAAIVPAAATLYCMGIDAMTGEVAGFDLSPINTYRWEAEYEAVQLDQMPHRVLTRPVQVAEYFFDGERKAKGRDSLLKLEVIAEGTLNAIVFWFDLHLDDVDTITTAPVGYGKGGKVRGGFMGEKIPAGTACSAAGTAGLAADATAGAAAGLAADATGAAAAGAAAGAEGAAPAAIGVVPAVAGAAPAGKQPSAEPGSPPTKAEQKSPSGKAAVQAVHVLARAVHDAASPVTDSTSGAAADAPAALAPEPANVTAAAAALAEASLDSGSESARPDFMPCQHFRGRIPGQVFKLGDLGLGYYWDALESDALDECQAEGQPAAQHAHQTQHSASACACPAQPRSGSCTDGRQCEGGTAMGSGGAVDAGEGGAVVAGGQEGAQQDGAQQEGSQQAQQEGEPQHHWGQALQYLDRAVQVAPGRKVTLLAKRDGSKVRFTLRQGVGEWVGRAPWRIEWGGGASVENPHFQRVHYCELLVRDFLMRVRSKRFPPIEKDFKMVLAHCGSLFLDPAALQQTCHELVLLEKLHRTPEFSPGASLNALTKLPLRMY